MISEKIAEIVKANDELIMQTFAKYGYTIEDLKKTIDNNKCFVIGDTENYFVDGKYVFSVKKEKKYYETPNTSYTYKVILNPYYDATMKSSEW